MRSEAEIKAMAEKVAGMLENQAEDEDGAATEVVDDVLAWVLHPEAPNSRVTDWLPEEDEAKLHAATETAQEIDEFLADPEGLGVRRTRPDGDSE